MRILLIFAALSFAQPAFAETIDFDGVSADDLLASPYTEDGFTITKTAGGSSTLIDVAPYSQPYNPGPDPVLGMFVTGTATLTESGGGVFDFQSFDYEGNFIIASGNDVLVTSDLGGSFSTNTFGTHDLSADPLFQGVTSVTFNDAAGGNWFWSIDNLNATNAVPEPGAFAMALLLLGAATLLARRSHS